MADLEWRRKAATRNAGSATDFRDIERNNEFTMVSDLPPLNQFFGARAVTTEIKVGPRATISRLHHRLMRGRGDS
jgi:hypothetical protein